MSLDDELAAERVADVLGEGLLDKLAAASRAHNVAITVVIAPIEQETSPRDPNDR